MRFSTVATSVVLFGTAALAVPGQTIYQTEIQTITSCAPEVKSCPGKSHASTAVPPSYTNVPEPIASKPAEPVHSEPAHSVPVHSVPAPIGTGTPSKPSHSVPAPIGTGTPSKPSGTGSYTPPKNSSVPATPSIPSYGQGSGASATTFSAVAVFAGAVAALFLA